MWRFLFIAFFLVHAGIHAAIWATPAPKDPNASFDAGHSWLLGDQRVLALVLALLAPEEVLVGVAAAVLAGRSGARLAGHPATTVIRCKL
jgi:hypothetical protein